MSEWIINYPRQLYFNNNNNKNYININNQNDDLYELHVDVTGYKPDDISVSTKDDLLIINGHYEQNDQHRNGYQSKEFTYKYQLPKFLVKDKMKCMFKDNGHLLIEAPIEQPNTRQIPIKILNEPSSTPSPSPSSSTSTTAKLINGHNRSSATSITTTTTNNNEHDDNNVATITTTSKNNSVSHV
ncbi:hypothetical protein HUG17_0967 [Dermatophagoides farinae]|uniref:SHSP domain-containing protein n=1 Tax=Dermatophagoides farinae TaxID=6954 RepID=A0A9D4SK40_DERFA|nr:hypothetical protein HUG17_0967 [Dermatophagoides farinae]